MGSITNHTGAPVWLRSPAGSVMAIAVGNEAPLVDGNYQISTAALGPTPPLPVATAIIFTNIGPLPLDFEADPPDVAPPFHLPPGGAAVLSPNPYHITE